VTGQAAVVVSFAVLWGAQLCFSYGWGVAGGALTIAGWAILWFGRKDAGNEIQRWDKSRTVTLAVALLLAALALRLWKLGGHPPVWWDEGVEAYDARCLAAGLPLEGLGDISYHRSPLWSRLVMLAGAGGHWTFASMRLPSALTGSVMVVLAAVLPAYGRLAGLLAGLILVFHPWAIHMSRVTMGNILVPAAGAAVVIIAGFTRLSLLWRAAAAGAITGIALYGYAGALQLPIVGILAIFLLSGRETLVPRRLRALAVFAAVTIAVIAPYRLFSPGLFDKTANVSAVGSPSAILWNIADTVPMFNVRGDNDLRHQFPAGAPVLGDFLGPVFLLGLGLALRNIREPVSLMVLGWLAAALLPGIASAGGSRNLFRMVGALVPMALLCGAGGAALWRALGRRLGAALIAIMWTLAALSGARRYFTDYQADPGAKSWFRTYNMEAAGDLAVMAGRGQITIAPPLTLAYEPLEKLALFDVARSGKVRYSQGSCSGASVVRKVYRDAFGNTQAVMRTSARGDCVEYRTVLSLGIEGDSLVASGHPGEAIRLYSRWDALVGGSVFLRERMGFAELKAGRPKEAEKAFRKAIGNGPGTAAAWDGLAAALLRQGMYDGAEKAVERAIQLEPEAEEFARDLAEVRKAKAAAGKTDRRG